MNREIKFRGKRISNGEWLSGDLMHDNIGGSYIYPIKSEGLYNATIVKSLSDLTDEARYFNSLPWYKKMFYKFKL